MTKDSAFSLGHEVEPATSREQSLMRTNLCVDGQDETLVMASLLNVETICVNIISDHAFTSCIQV